MKILDHLTSRKFNALEVIGLLTVTLLGVSTLAWAVTLPFTFSSGTTAKASEVNANFDALENAVTTLETKADQIETALADLETTVAASGDFVWRDGSGAVISDSPHFIGLSAIGILYQDPGKPGVRWMVGVWGLGSSEPAGGILNDDLPPVSLLYENNDCTGIAYVVVDGNPAAWGSLATGIGIPFKISGESNYRIVDESDTLRAITALSQDDGGGCSAVGPTSFPTAAVLGDTVPSTAIIQPSDLTPPIYISFR